MAGDAEMGAVVFYEVSRALKRAGAGDLRKTFHKDMISAARPLLPAVRRQAASRFPKRGGLAKRMAMASRYEAVAKTAFATAGVSVRMKKADPRVDRQGRVVHPVPDGRGGFLRNAKGRRLVVVQYVPEAVGFFRETIEDRADLVRADMIRRLERWIDDNFAGDLGG